MAALSRCIGSASAVFALTNAPLDFRPVVAAGITVGMFSWIGAPAMAEPGLIAFTEGDDQPGSAFSPTIIVLNHFLFTISISRLDVAGRLVTGGRARAVDRLRFRPDLPYRAGRPVAIARFFNLLTSSKPDLSAVETVAQTCSAGNVEGGDPLPTIKLGMSSLSLIPISAQTFTRYYFGAAA